MALSIGIDVCKDTWKTCLMENGQTLETCSFTEPRSVLIYVNATCALYPEPTIALSTGTGTPLVAINSLLEQHDSGVAAARTQQEQEVTEFLMAVRSLNLHSYSLPAVKHLPTVPMYRKLSRADMGTAGLVCLVAALLYRMREREASWSEMRFIAVEMDEHVKSMLVVDDGRLVNGIGGTAGSMNYQGNTYIESQGDESVDAQRANEVMAEESFWEGFIQDMAGLMAIHHCEDIVVVGKQKQVAIAKLADIYPCYHFPYRGGDQEGFEAAIGAAIIAEGLYRPGIAAEVVERLRLRHGGRLLLAASRDNTPLLL